MNRRDSNKQGFTLIELIIVIAVLGIIALVAVPKFTKYTRLSKARKVQADCVIIEKAVLLYHLDTEQWPEIKSTLKPNSEGLTGIGSTNKPSGWNGPYLESWPLNPFSESKIIDGNEHYALDYYSDAGLCIDIILPNSLSKSHQNEVFNYLEKIIDNGDGNSTNNTGKLRRRSPSARYVVYVIE